MRNLLVISDNTRAEAPYELSDSRFRTNKRKYFYCTINNRSIQFPAKGCCGCGLLRKQPGRLLGGRFVWVCHPAVLWGQGQGWGQAPQKPGVLLGDVQVHYKAVCPSVCPVHAGQSTHCMSLCVCWLVQVLVRDWKFIFTSTRQRFLSSSSHVCVPMDVCFISCPLLNSCINTRRLILKRASVLPPEHS